MLLEKLDYIREYLTTRPTDPSVSRLVIPFLPSGHPTSSLSSLYSLCDCPGNRRINSDELRQAGSDDHHRLWPSKDL